MTVMDMPPTGRPDPRNTSRPGAGERLAQVLPFRPRVAQPSEEPLTWYEAHRFERGARYREVPTGRTGYFIGVSEVPPLTAIDLSALVLLFRDPDTGAMWICSESEAMVGVGYLSVGWEHTT